MSWSRLLVDNGSKPWANLFVNDMTVYNNLNVEGSETHSGDMTIKGKLTLDNSNNQDATALEIIGLKNLETDGFITTHSSLQVDDEIYGKDMLLTGNSRAKDYEGETALFSGNVDSKNTLYEKEYDGNGSATVVGNYKVQFVESGGMVTAQLLAADFQFVTVSTSDAAFDPKTQIPEKYLPPNDIDVVCWMTSDTGVSLGIVRIKTNGRIEMGPSVVNNGAGIQTFNSGETCGLWSNCCINYFSKRL